MHVTIFDLTAQTNKPGRNIFVGGTEFYIIADIVTHHTFGRVLTYTVPAGTSWFRVSRQVLRHMKCAKCIRLNFLQYNMAHFQIARRKPY